MNKKNGAKIFQEQVLHVSQNEISFITTQKGE
jgi:hypothetical protein